MNQNNFFRNLFILFYFILAVDGTIEILKSEGLSCSGCVVDIANRAQVHLAAIKLKDDIGPVDILINNAGIVCCKPLWDLPEKVIENTYAVNILAHYWVCVIYFKTFHFIENYHHHSF